MSHDVPKCPMFWGGTFKKAGSGTRNKPMRMRVILSGCLIAAGAVIAGAAAVPPPTPGADSKATVTELTPEQKQFFETKIRPIFSEHCYKCNSAADNKTKGGLTLDTREGLLKGGEAGVVFVAGIPDISALINEVGSAGGD